MTHFLLFRLSEHLTHLHYTQFSYYDTTNQQVWLDKRLVNCSRCHKKEHNCRTCNAAIHNWDFPLLWWGFYFCLWMFTFIM